MVKMKLILTVETETSWYCNKADSTEKEQRCGGKS